MRTLGVIDTLERNYLARHYRPDAVFPPLREVAAMVQKAKDLAHTIMQDPLLSAEGRFMKRKAAMDAAAAEIAKWRDKRLPGFDGDLSAQRAALMPTAKPPDPRKVDHLVAVLRTLTTEEVAICYGSASEDERVLMEAASALVGRVPQRTNGGGIAWTPLLDPDTVTATVTERAESANPAGAERLRELAEVRAMNATVASCALEDLKALANAEFT